MSLPTLVVVSGPSGSGKTTLAHALARQIGCPAICRDEIKEGMVHATPGFVPGPGDELTWRTLPTFFKVIELLLREGSTVVAEAAFQDRLWRPGLQPLMSLANIRIVHCVAPLELASQRRLKRADENPIHARAHGMVRLAMDSDLVFDAISIEAPALRVDTSDGYRPGIEEIVAFINLRP